MDRASGRIEQACSILKCWTQLLSWLMIAHGRIVLTVAVSEPKSVCTGRWNQSTATVLQPGKYRPVHNGHTHSAKSPKTPLIQQVALILTRAHHACTIGRVDFSAEPSVCFMRYGSITLKSAVGPNPGHTRTHWDES